MISTGFRFLPLLVLSSCAAKQVPEICHLAPPENPEYYAEYMREWNAADCENVIKNLRLKEEAAANQT